MDASVIVDAVADAGPRGLAARGALGGQPSTEPLLAPGLFAVEVMSGLRAATNRPGFPLRVDDLPQLLLEAEGLGIEIEATPWPDVRRAWDLAQGSLRYADAIYVAAAERHRTALLTSDERIERSGAPLNCRVVAIRGSG